MLPPWTVRMGAALLGAAAGAVAVGGLVTAGPGMPEQASVPQAAMPTAAVSAPATPTKTADVTATAAAAIAPAAGGTPAEQLAALEDISDGQASAKLPVKPDSAPNGGAAAPLRPQVEKHTLEVAKGDTLMKVLLKAGSDRREAHAAVTALSSVYDLRRLMPGQTVTVAFRGGSADDKADGPPQLTDVVLRVSPERDAIARLDDAGRFTGKEIERQLETRPQRADARIDDSLYLAAQRAGVPPEIILELIRLYSFDVDFQRDIQPGDSFEVLYESRFLEDGDLANHGEILYAQLTVGGTALPLYRYRTSDGLTDYFNGKGHSVRKALMKTPIDGARLSSRFGKRRHPILGYTKMHRGVDFAAPRGTPIMAAGRGTVEVAGWNGGYGRYVRIRHNGRYKTAYGHMTRIAKGVKPGKRVRQGQVIGYVGSTGRSTGPHLHYEVHADGRQMNPLGLKLPSGRKLKGEELGRFQEERIQLDGVFAGLEQERKVAQSTVNAD